MIKRIISILLVTILAVGGYIGIPQLNKPESAKAAIASMTDLTDLSTYKKRRAQHKNAPFTTNNAEFDLLNVTSGAGIVNHVWLADRPNGAGYPEFDHSIRVYVNGSSTPSMDMDLGMFFGYAYADSFPNPANISSEHWTARYGGPSNLDRTGGTFSLPIPFQSGIRIAVANTNNTPSSVFSQVDYTLVADNAGMTVPPYTLNVIGNKWIGGRATVGSTSEATLATIPSGEKGVIVGHSMAGGGANDYSYLERQLALYIDGETTSSIKSSGTEDWFEGSDYFFTGQSPYSMPGAMGLGAAKTSNIYPCPFSALVDFLSLNGGFAFQSSATLKLLSHSAVSTSNTYASALWYYREN